MALKTTIQLRRDTLAAWTTANPVLANGEVALVDKNNGVGNKKWVIRIGDGSTPFVDLPETDYVINDQLSAYALSTDVQTQINEVTGKIDNKIKVKTKDAEEATSVETLKIEKITPDKYYEKVQSETGIDEDTLYIIEGTNINAYGQVVSNVAAGSADTDAVNVGQLKSVSADLDQKITDIVAGDMSAAIGTLSGEVTTKINNVNSDLNTFKEATNGSITGINTTLSSLDTRLGTAEGKITTAEGKISANEGEISGVKGRLDTAEGKISTLEGQVETITTTTIPGLETSLKVVVTGGQTDEAGDVKYTLTQGGTSIGDIIVPRDIFVETAVLGEDNKLILTLKDGTTIPVDLAKFIDTYTSKDSSTIDVTVENREISAEVIDGSIVEAKLGDKAVTTAKIADEAVTATQIANNTITMAKLSSTDTFIFDCGGAS